MHAMLLHPLGLHRQEGAGAHVQRQSFASDAAPIQLIDEARCEMQSRGGRCDRSVLAREHRLVIVAVGLVRGATRRDVGGKRHSPGAVEKQLDRFLAVEMQQYRPVRGLLDGRSADPASELDQVAVTNTPGVAHEGPPFAGPFALVEGRADARIPAMSFQLRRDYARVVENEHVAGAENPRQVENGAITDVRAFHQQQSR